MKIIGSLAMAGLFLVACTGETTPGEPDNPNYNSTNNVGENTPRQKQYSVRNIPAELCESSAYQNAIKDVMSSEASPLFTPVDHHGCGIINDTCSYGPYSTLPNADSSESKLCRIEYNGASIDRDLIHSVSDEQLAIYYSK